MRTLFMAAVMLLMSMSTATADQSETPYLIAQGIGQIEVIPDELHWEIDLGNTGSEADKTMRRHLEIITEVRAVLKSFNIREDEIVASQVKFGDNWKYTKRGRKRAGYQANSHFSFILRDFSRYDSLMIILSNVPIIRTIEVGIDHSERVRFVKEAILLALEDARTKAVAMAETMGVCLGKVYKIEPQTAVPWRYSQPHRGGPAGPIGVKVSDTQSLIIDKIAFDANVTVTYYLIE